MSFFRERDYKRKREITKEHLPSSIIKPYNEREILFQKNKQNKNPRRKPTPELMGEVTRFVRPDIYLTDNAMH